MLLTGFAFEGEVFIVHFLVVRPGANRQLHSLREPCLQVHFYTYPGIVVYGLVVCLINEFPYSIPYILKRFIVPVVNQQIGNPNLYMNLLGQFYRGIKIRGPAIQIQSLGSHKVWSISKYEILIFLIYKLKEKEATAEGVAGNSLLEMGLLVSLDPIVGGFC